MAGQPGQRQLPQWYLDKVNMASEVWQGNPGRVDLSMPYINHANSGGQGVQSPRIGRVAHIHYAATIDLPGLTSKG